MPKDTFQTQIKIIGLVDYLCDILKSGDNFLEVRTNLLGSIQAVFTNKLLENPEVADTFNSTFQNLPKDATLETTMKAFASATQGKNVNIDSAALLKESAREILSEFVNKAQRPELSKQIDLLL